MEQGVVEHILFKTDEIISQIEMMEIARILPGAFSLKEYKNCVKGISFGDINKVKIFSE